MPPALLNIRLHFRKKEVYSYEKNISAEKASAQKSAWLYEENVRRKRQKSFGASPCKGQKKIVSLIRITGRYCGNEFCLKT